MKNVPETTPEDDGAPEGSPRHRDLDPLLHKQLRFTIVAAEAEVSVESLLNYSRGSVILLPDMHPDRMRLEIEGVPLASGQAVTVDSRLALRLEVFRSLKEFIAELGEREIADENPPDSRP